MATEDREDAAEAGAALPPGTESSPREADGGRRLRVRVAGPPLFSRSVCSLLRDMPWTEDVAPLTTTDSKAVGGPSAAESFGEALRGVDVLLVAVPGTADLLRRLTEAREAGTPVPALALLTVGGHIFRSEMAVAERLGIRVFLSVRDGADTLRGGVRAAMRGENYCSPDLRSLQKEIEQILTQGEEAIETAVLPENER
jgi:hypothetical protein